MSILGVIVCFNEYMLSFVVVDKEMDESIVIGSQPAEAYNTQAAVMRTAIEDDTITESEG